MPRIGISGHSNLTTDTVPLADAIEVVTGRVCLVDGTITPCWSYSGHPELWRRKRGTTGFNAQLASLLDGTPGLPLRPAARTHDKTAFDDAPVADIIGHSCGGIGDKGYQGTILVTHERNPREEN